MIVKNESFFLRDCLQRACDHVDDIVVVDTGSTDNTREIAADFTDKVLDYAWHDHFADARNYALQQASGNWIVVLDADEVIEPAHWRELRALIATTDQDAFFLQQHNYSREPHVEGWLPVTTPTAYTRDYPGYKKNPIARLFRNQPDIRYTGRVHEVVDHTLREGHFQTLDVPIHHYMDDDPAKPKRERQLNYLRIIEQGLDAESDGRLYAAAGSIRLHYLEDFAGAIGHLQKAVELGHLPEQNRESIAEACYRMGDMQQAYRGYWALYRSGYRSFNLCNNLANLSAKAGKYAQAAQLLEHCLQFAGVDPQVRERLQHNLQFLQAKASQQ
jgi:glycosyltransferase involved in cell wall biosynthesis